MDLIIGGAYQGKTEYARKKYGLDDSDIYSCSKYSGIEFGAKCINKIEEFTLWCVKNGCDAVDIFRRHLCEWKGSVLICNDIFCGVVPLGADMRQWREMTGRLCNYLSENADNVIRIFCGLEQKLK